MKVYVSGSWSHRIQIRELAEYLERRVPGFESTSTWLRSGLTEAEIDKVGPQVLIDEDYVDVERADVYLLVNGKNLSSSSPGKWIEFGYALASGKLCVVWGNEQTSLFMQDRFVIWLPEDNRESLVLTLAAVKTALNSVNLGEFNAHREDEGGGEGRVRIGTPTSPHEDRSEGARPGIRTGEGGALRHLIREIRRRAARVRSS